MRADLLIANRRQYVSDRLRQLAERDDTFVISQAQVKSDALGDVIGEPPAGITSFVSGPCDRRMQPIAVKFEQLSRARPEIWKFLFKRDHDFYLRALASEGRRWSSSALFQEETIPVE